MEKGREGRKEEIGRRVGGVSHGESRTQRGVVNELSSVYSLYLSCLSVCLYVSKCVYISACDVLRHRFPLRICPCVCVSPFLCLRLVLFSRCPSLSLCLQVCGSVPGSFFFAAFVSGRIIVCLLVFLSPRLRLCMSGSVTAPIQSIKHHLHVMSCCCCCFYVCCCSRYHW